MITEEQIIKLKGLIDDKKILEKRLEELNNFIPEDGIKVRFKYRRRGYSELAEIYFKCDKVIEVLKEEVSSKIDQLNEKINSLQLVEINNTLEI